MDVSIRIPSPLKKLTGGQDVVKTEGKTVGEAVQRLVRTYPDLKERLMDEQGMIRRFINIYVNGEDVRFIEGLEMPLKEGDQLSIVPAIAGGSLMVNA